MSSLTPIWLDTNVVVRYLTKTSEGLAQQAAGLIDTDQPLLVSCTVLAECLFVLTSFYQIPRTVAIDAVSQFVQRANIQIPTIAKPLAVEALASCRDSGRIGIVDALLWAEARTSGITTIFTFDRRFPRSGVDLLP